MVGGEYFLTAPVPVEDSLGEMIEQSLGCISFFASGRDALATLLSELPQPEVSLPDLICVSVHDACRAARKTCNIYRVGLDFMHDTETSDIKKTSIVFIMHYFGVRNDALMKQAQNQGSTIISDVTHLLFDRVGLLEVAHKSDFLIASLRKSGPFPDGGFISSLKHRTPQPKHGLRETFLVTRAAGLLSRGLSAERNFSDEENLYFLKRAEALLDETMPASFSCSYLSRRLSKTVAVDATASVIRKNIDVLAAGLQPFSQAQNIPTVISPYFPCIFDSVESRDNVRSCLASNRFFFPTHWPSAGLSVVSPLTTRSLSIPCDGRYDETVMRSVVSIIETCLPHRTSRS